MKVVEGDLLDMFDNGEFDVIAHGCNCFCTMGSGIAALIRERYPSVYEVDYHETEQGDINKLGTYTYDYPFGVDDDRKVYNLYTQFDFGAPTKCHLNYDALSLLLYKLNKLEKGKKIGLPMIGCGLAGGDEALVVSIIERQLKNCDVTLVKFNK